MPAEEKNRTQRTADAILRFIAEQGLQPGGRLPNESELSRRLEVGRRSAASFRTGRRP